MQALKGIQRALCLDALKKCVLLYLIFLYR